MNLASFKTLQNIQRTIIENNSIWILSFVGKYVIRDLQYVQLSIGPVTYSHASYNINGIVADMFQRWVNSTAISCTEKS